MTDQEADPGLLEARYRRLLRVLPASYRSVREQEMVDTFLDSRYDAEPELADLTASYGRPSPAEVLSVLGLALRLRWGGADAPARYRARAAATRTFALLGLLMLAIWATLLLQARWGGTPWWPHDDPTASSNQPGHWRLLADYAAALWIPAYLAVLLGGARLGQLLGSVALVPPVADVVLFPGLLQTWAALIVGSVVVAALGAFRRDTPAVARRPWLVAGLAGILALQALPLAVRLQTGLAWALFDETGLWAVAALAAAVILLVPARRSPTEQRVGRLLAVVAFAVAVLLLRAADTADFLAMVHTDDSLRSTVLATYVVQLLVIAGIGATAAVAGIRGLRRLPIVGYGPARRRPGVAG